MVLLLVDATEIHSTSLTVPLITEAESMLAEWNTVRSEPEASSNIQQDNQDLKSLSIVFDPLKLKITETK